MRMSYPKLLVSTVSAMILWTGCSGEEQSETASKKAREREIPELQIFSYNGPLMADIKKIEPVESPAEVHFKVAGGVSIRDIINLEPANPNEVGWPALPRRMLNYEKTSSWDQTLHFGYEGSIFDVVDVSATGNFSFGLSTTKTLLLIKNTPTNSETMIEPVEEPVVDENGDPVLGVDGEALTKVIGHKPYTSDGYDYVALCVYSTKVENALRFQGSVKVLGNGVTEGGGFGESFDLSQYSSFFRISDADTIPSLINLCVEVYETEVKEVVKEDLRMIMQSATHDKSSLNNTSFAIQAALYGPRLDRIKVHGHHWNVEKASIEAKDGGLVKVRGKLHHNIRGQFNDTINYECNFDKGVETHWHTRIEQRSLTSGWRDAGRRLIKEICHDAYIEFSRD